MPKGLDLVKPSFKEKCVENISCIIIQSYFSIHIPQIFLCTLYLLKIGMIVKNLAKLFISNEHF